ncbi:hypothetical protein, partial [Roseivirga sp. E12]|uniref:hypothetical protein n=1 Tax=Roseivirga sp. E12 TaxID=2819237 RepID=UPI001ABC1496
DLQSGALLISFDSNGEYRSSNAEFSTESGTSDGTRPSNWSTDPNANVWFKFVAPSNGEVEVEAKVYGSEGYMQYARLALFDAQGSELSSVNHIQGNSDVSLSAENLTSGSEYFLTVDQGNGESHRRGTFTLSMDFVADPHSCISELWAIADGNWSDPNIWSDTEGGSPISTIPCDQSVVHIKGFDVSFSNTLPVTVKRIVIVGLASTNTRLSIISGELNVIEKIVTSGNGAKLKTNTSSTIRVTGVGGS